MNDSKRKKLEGAGWKVGTVAEFLGLSAEEEMLVEVKLALADRVRARRQQLELTQHQFAKRIGSSQSRVAKIEAADNSVSVDLLVRSLAALGASRKEIGRIIMGAPTEMRSDKRRHNSPQAKRVRRTAKA